VTVRKRNPESCRYDFLRAGHCYTRSGFPTAKIARQGETIHQLTHRVANGAARCDPQRGD
jgi:hypothetical protein